MKFILFATIKGISKQPSFSFSTLKKINNLAPNYNIKYSLFNFYGTNDAIDIPLAIELSDNILSKTYRYTKRLKRLFPQSEKNEESAILVENDRLIIKTSKESVWTPKFVCNMNELEFNVKKSSLADMICNFNRMISNKEDIDGLEIFIGSEYTFNELYEDLAYQQQNGINISAPPFTIDQNIYNSIQNDILLDEKSLLLYNVFLKKANYSGFSYPILNYIYNIFFSEKINQTILLSENSVVEFTYKKMYPSSDEKKGLFSYIIPGSEAGVFELQMYHENQIISKKTVLLMVCADLFGQTEIIKQLKNNSITVDDIILISGSIDLGLLNMLETSVIMNDNAKVIYNDRALGSFLYKFKKTSSGWRYIQEQPDEEKQYGSISVKSYYQKNLQPASNFKIIKK